MLNRHTATYVNFAATLCALVAHTCLAGPIPNAIPRWEIGVGVGVVSFPDYPGAKERRTLVLPFPYILYHSRYLDVNRRQVRGTLLNLKRLSLELNFAGAVAVDSARDRERQGMPNLGWIGEAGPAVRYRIWNNADRTIQLYALLPLRVAVSAQGFTLQHRGFVFAPQLELVRHLGDDRHGYRIDAGVSALYGTNSYFQYLYGVPPPYATAARPAYAATGGYGGYQVSIGGSLHHVNMVYGAFIGFSNLDGAAFTTSPLVSRTHYVTMGIAVAWIFSRSR